jgi:hypothetical protein
MQKRIFLGIIPILLAAIWVNGNMTLPGEFHRLFQDKLGWPWLSFEESSALVRAAIDAVLTAAAYWVTMLMMRRQRSREAGVMTLGIALFVVMSSWQYTGHIAWSFRTPPYLSDLLYFVLLTCAFWLKKRRLVFFALALILTPFMSVDRLLFSMLTLGFLTILFKFRRLGQDWKWRTARDSSKG